MGSCVLALATDAYGSYGGIAQYNRDFISALASLDQVDRITVLPRLAPDAAEGVPHKVHVHTATRNKLIYAARAMAVCAARRPDIIYNGHLYHGPLAHRLASLFGAKLVSQLHGTETWSTLPARHLKPLEASDIVLCVSNDTKHRYLKQAAPGTDNAVVVHNTVGDEFTPGDRAEARRKFALTNEFVILTVGRLDPRNGGYKGHERVIRALSNVAADRHSITYLIAGIGDDRRRLEQVVCDAGVERSVQFLGKVATEDLPDLYRAADLFALPSTGEGFGIVFLEAMACGTPAIGLDVGGVADALDDGELGILCAPDTFEATFSDTLIATSTTGDEARTDLAARTRARFGPEIFHNALASALGPLITSRP